MGKHWACMVSFLFVGCASGRGVATARSNKAVTMEELEKIEAATLRGEIEPCKLKYRAQVRAEPEAVLPRVKLAWCTMPTEDAWNQLKALGAVAPNDPWVLFGLGRVYAVWNGMSDRSQASFEAALKVDSAFFPALIGLGDLARRREVWAAAQERYRAALLLTDDPTARGGLGLALLALGQAAQAKIELEAAVKAFPDQPEVLSALLQIEGAGAAATGWAQTLTELKPKDKEAWKRLAELRDAAGDAVGATKALEKWVALGEPPVAALRRLSELYQRLGDTEKEERTLMLWAGTVAKGTEANLRLAQLNLNRGDAEVATGHWLEALARDPLCHEAREALAEQRLKEGVYYEALEEVRQVLSQAPERPTARELEKRLQAAMHLGSSRAKGSVNDIFAAVQASLAQFYRLRLEEKPQLQGSMKLRVRVSPQGQTLGVDVLSDGINDSALLGHAYFGLRDAQFSPKKSEPVFEFSLGVKGRR